MSNTNSHGGYWSSPQGIVVIIMVSAVSYLLWTEHRAHVIEALPWVILLLCPVMHVFMHGGHGDHHSTDTDHESPRENNEEK